MRPAQHAALFVESRRAKGLSPGTLRTYEIHLSQFLQSAKQIDSRTVSSYLADLQSRSSPGYCWTQARTLRTFCRWLHRAGYIKRPIPIEMPRYPWRMGRVFNEQEVRSLLDAATDRERAIVLLLIDTGLRRAEACSLSWDDLEGNTIRLRQGKGGRGRIVLVGEHTLSALQCLRQRSTGSLIGLKPEGLRAVLMRLGQRAGVEQVTCHAFRRTFATWMIRGGTPLMHVQRLMGHRTLNMILRYAQVTGEDLQAVYRSPADSLG